MQWVAKFDSNLIETSVVNALLQTAIFFTHKEETEEVDGQMNLLASSSSV